MKLLLLTTGGKAPTWADEAVADYGVRLRRYVKMGEQLLRPEPFRGDVDAVRAAEGERLLAQIGQRDRLVVLDERGRSFDTPGFCSLLEDGLSAEGRLVFALGGPYGHAQAARDRAWRVVQLSTLVLNHQVARVLLYEQIYRAFTVLAGEPYHH